MRPFLCISVVLAALTGLAFGAPVAAAKECPKGVTEGNRAVTLKAKDIVAGEGLGCRRVRRLIRAYFNDALSFGDCYALGAEGRSTCRVAGWTFSTRYARNYRIRVRAKREGREFRFLRVDKAPG